MMQKKPKQSEDFYCIIVTLTQKFILLTLVSQYLRKWRQLLVLLCLNDCHKLTVTAELFSGVSLIRVPISFTDTVGLSILYSKRNMVAK